MCLMFLFWLLYIHSFCIFCLSCAALRGAATLKARALKEVWNIATVTPLERGIGGIGLCGKSINSNTSNTSTSDSGEVFNGENFLGACSQELIAKGSELLKRTRKGNINHQYAASTNSFFLSFAKMSKLHFGDKCR